MHTSRSWLTWVAVAAVVGVLGPMRAEAQPTRSAPARPFPAPTTGWHLERGTLLRLEPRRGPVMKARLAGAYGDTIVVHPLRNAQGPVAFTPADLEAAWFEDGGHGAQGALVGLGAGLFIKTVWALSECGGPCAPSGVESMVTLTLAGGGAVFGAIIGGSVPRWRPLEAPEGR